MEKIIERKYYDNLYRMDVVEVTVGDFQTKIAKWEDDVWFRLSVVTTPRCFVIDVEKRFKTVKEAKKYYLDGLKMTMEDTLELLRDIDYITKKKVKQ